MAKRVKESLVNVNPVRRLYKILGQNGVQSNHPRVIKMYKNWAKIYKTFIHNRFDAYSRGSGGWVPLAERTVRRKKSTIILVETKTLINAVDPKIYNAPGSFTRRRGNGIIIGFGGNVVHPSPRNKAGLTIQEIAEFHQEGGGNLPQRRIIVGPDRATIDLVTAEVNQAVNDILVEVSKE